MPGITDVAGVEVGHWTHPDQPTGCTVVVLPEPNVVTVEVRGGAPGSRETALLQPGMRVQQAQAILLTGGSAFGLSAADGVVSGLADSGRGHPTPAGPVPIVPAAVIFDLPRSTFRPDAAAGRAALDSASPGPVPVGLVGAGTGGTAAKWRGFEHMVPGGVGSWSVARDDVTVGALVVMNPVGDVFDLEGRALTGGDPVPGPLGLFPSPVENTTLSVVATDAAIDRATLTRLAVRAHDAYAVCIRPTHTRFDGDACFAVSCGNLDANPDLVAEMAFEAVGRAIENAIVASRP